MMERSEHMTIVKQMNETIDSLTKKVTELEDRLANGGRKRVIGTLPEYQAMIDAAEK